jgi:hypothetical protein
MALVAPLSKYKKNTYVIWIVVLAGFAAYCVYDAAYNEKFKLKHTEADGKPDSVLVFNQKAPPYLFGAAILLGAYLFIINHKKIVADDNALVIDNRITIAYEAIQKIDKTFFDSKGRFTITYKAADGNETDIEISDRNYDNLEAILSHVVSKIS